MCVSNASWYTYLRGISRRVSRLVNWDTTRLLIRGFSSLSLTNPFIRASTLKKKHLIWSKYMLKNKLVPKKKILDWLSIYNSKKNQSEYLQKKICFLKSWQYTNAYFIWNYSLPPSHYIWLCQLTYLFVGLRWQNIRQKIILYPLLHKL